MDWLASLLGLNSGDSQIAAADRNRDILSGAQTQGNNIIDTGYGKAGDALASLSGMYQPLANSAVDKGNMYANALGINGASGNATATSAYQASPGYQYTLDQSLQALDRSAAAHGTLQSGQSGIDYLKTASGLANQDYGNWLSALGSSGDILGAGLSGEGNALADKANLATGQANDQLSLLGGVTSGQLGASNQQAAGEQANSEGLSNLFGNIVGGIGSIATGGLSNLAKVGNVFGNATQGAAGNVFGYGGF